MDAALAAGRAAVIVQRAIFDQAQHCDVGERKFVKLLNAFATHRTSRVAVLALFVGFA